MSVFLSDEWLGDARAAFASLPEVDGADGVVQYVVSGGPSGRFQAYVHVRSGQVTELVAGKHPDPDCSVSLSYADALDLLNGELSPEVAFMSGRAKVEGDHRVWLLDLRPVRTSAEWASGIESLRATTRA